MRTPWGESQCAAQLAEGIVQHETAGHGGIHLAPERNAKVPAYMRNADGWYEEDCEWSIVGCVFPEAFGAGVPEMARKTLRGWYPAHYETFYGVTLKPGESYVRDQELAGA